MMVNMEKLSTKLIQHHCLSTALFWYHIFIYLSGGNTFGLFE